MGLALQLWSESVVQDYQVDYSFRLLSKVIGLDAIFVATKLDERRGIAGTKDCPRFNSMEDDLPHASSIVPKNMLFSTFVQQVLALELDLDGIDKNFKMSVKKCIPTELFDFEDEGVLVCARTTKKSHPDEMRTEKEYIGSTPPIGKSSGAKRTHDEMQDAYMMDFTAIMLERFPMLVATGGPLSWNQFSETLRILLEKGVVTGLQVNKEALAAYVKDGPALPFGLQETRTISKSAAYNYSMYQRDKQQANKKKRKVEEEAVGGDLLKDISPKSKHGFILEALRDRRGELTGVPYDIMGDTRKMTLFETDVKGRATKSAKSTITSAKNGTPTGKKTRATRRSKTAQDNKPSIQGIHGNDNVLKHNLHLSFPQYCLTNQNTNFNTMLAMAHNNRSARKMKNSDQDIVTKISEETVEP